MSDGMEPGSRFELNPAIDEPRPVTQGVAEEGQDAATFSSGCLARRGGVCNSAPRLAMEQTQ